MDPSSLAIQKSIRLPDCNPSQHDCRFLPDSHVIATTGGNLISYVDIKTERVDVDRVENLAADSGIRHFAMASDGSLIMQANRITDLGSRITDLDRAWRYHDGDLVASHHSGGRCEAFAIPAHLRQKFNRELIDPCFDQSGTIVGVVLNKIGLVSFWNFQTGQALAEVAVPDAGRMQLSKTGEHFIVLTRRGLRFISSTTLCHDPTLDQFDEFLSTTLSEKVVMAHCRIT